MTDLRRRVLLVQLPIPPLGPQPIRGNVPLAAGYLKLFARTRGLEAFYNIDIFPPKKANRLGDQALVEAVLASEPWMVGFTCYLWNIDRTLWIAQRLKEQKPELKVVLGGPEITADNAWVLDHPAIDYAVIGEGEQTFADLLTALIYEKSPPVPINGLAVLRHNGQRTTDNGRPPAFRQPLPNLESISSPYLAGILDAADEEMLLLETIRGCIFKCKFCYYPKSYDGLYFLSREKIVANLRHAQERGAREVVLLDPTLNQRKDFADFLKLLADCNPGRQFTYFGELRGEGITEEIAGLLREANFTEVEIGLQSIDPHAQELMDRKNNLRAFERGARAMLKEGIKVKVDLIIGLPGDTADSVRRGMHYLRESGLYTDVQVFNLSILPGTAFRQEAEQLGLRFQPRPPYYVLETPTMDRQTMFQLMQEARDIFQMDWDSLPRPKTGMVVHADLDDPTRHRSRIPRIQTYTLWLRAHDFHRRRYEAADMIATLLEENPFATLQVALEPVFDERFDGASVEELLSRDCLEGLLAACYKNPTYLDRFYALQPGRPIGSKRLLVLLPRRLRPRLSRAWLQTLRECATIVWKHDTDVYSISPQPSTPNAWPAVS